jgi:glycosyltransferase involved in cell wall biosynthesis
VKILFVCSSLDLRHPFSSTPAWWQLLKSLCEAGVEVVATPYQGYAIESLWWKAYDNPCQWEGTLFKKARDTARAMRGSRGGKEEGTNAKESSTDMVVRRLANALIRPRWERHLSDILESERDIDAIIILTVPPNHLRGLPTYIKQRCNLPIIFYDADVPASLPRFRGFASGFKIYQGADLTEYDGFISNSKAGAEELMSMGARNVNVLYYGVDPHLFSRVNVEQDIDVFFYGHGHEYRRDWIEAMIAEPSRQMAGARFAVRVASMGIDLGNTERLPYASFSKLREYICRSRINLNITRKAHASVYASSTCRPFELAAMGCCIVSNPVKGMEEWFEVGREVVMVDDGKEVVETYRWLLSDDESRRKIGSAARGRVVREHTYRHRASQLVRILEGFVS